MKYALITGASSGIGLEYARQLAARGYNIVVVSNQQEANEKVAKALTETYSVQAIPFFADLTQGDAAQKVYDFCHTRPDMEVEMLICNAGMLHFGKLIHTEGNTVERIVHLHCLIPAQLCRLFAKDMCQRHQGYILLMSSLAAWTDYPTMSLYGSTKVFLRHFGQSLWYELHGEGVSVTTVFPSAVDTGFFKLDESIRKNLRRCGLIIPPERLVKGALRALFACRRRYVPDLWTHLEIGLCRIIPTRMFLLFMKVPAIRKLLDGL